MSDPRPIGLFDSGVGGLTVLEAVARRMPFEDLLYLGDTARLPYGTKSPETVRRYARRAIGFLLAQGVKAVAAARASDPAGTRAPIAVLATEATVMSDAYGHAIRALDPGRDVTHTACALFVPLAEEGWTENEVAHAAASLYLADVARSGARVVVLGCTHYPLLAHTIAGALPPGTLLVDSAETAARAVEAALPPAFRRGETSHGTTRLLVTDASERLRRVAGRFLGRPAADLTLIDLP